MHKRFFGNFAHALMHAVIDPDIELSPDGSASDPDDGLSRTGHIRAWSDFYEHERLEKGYDLTRAERPFFVSATARGKAAIERSGGLAGHAVHVEPWDDNVDPWDCDIDGFGEYCCVDDSYGFDAYDVV